MKNWSKYILILLLGAIVWNTETALANRQRRKRRDTERDITADEIIEITDDSEIKDDPDTLADKKMMEEWDVHMSDFVPDDMLTVEIQPREEIVSFDLFVLHLSFSFSQFMRMRQKNQFI